MESVETNKNLPIEYRSEQGRLNILGFWIFLGAEIALFATLFATYFVM
ncbi:cytochrome aa3 quinol oxidase subunit III, partial [Escherichia coli]|nr:cytochrome aa3 quinol oxidase subunit III [Escherichia coli]